MEQKNKKTKFVNSKALKITSLIILSILLIFLVLRVEDIPFFLEKLNKHYSLLPEEIWIWVIKIFTYLPFIGIDYITLLLITNSHKYPIYMTLISIGSLLIGYLVFFAHFSKDPNLILGLNNFFVKLVKSQVIFVFILATYLVECTYKDSSR